MNFNPPKIKTLQIKLIDDEYIEVIKHKNKLGAKNWPDYFRKIREHKE